MSNQIGTTAGLGIFGTGATTNNTSSYSNAISNQTTYSPQYSYNAGNQSYNYSPAFSFGSGSASTNSTLTPTAIQNPTQNISPSTSQTASATASNSQSSLLMYVIIGAVALGGLYFISKSSGSGSKAKTTNVSISPKVGKVSAV